jgi:type IV pilus assembly protein PilN
VARLTPLEQRVAKARSRLQKATTSAAKLEQDTAKITAQLVSVRSGSAFLEQLRRVTPMGVSLQSVEVRPIQLRMNGLAFSNGSAGGLEQINAFTINLESLPAVPMESAVVQKAEAGDGDSMNFSLQIGIDPSVKSTVKQLRELGADGLAARFEFLQKQGLPL